MRRAHGLGADPHDPRDNILAGTAYLRAMYDLYSYPGLFAAYNAGPERYGEYLRHGRSLPAETRTYLATVAQIDPGSLPSPSVASETRLRSEEHTSELQSLMRTSYAVFCLKKKNKKTTQTDTQ